MLLIWGELRNISSMGKKESFPFCIPDTCIELCLRTQDTLCFSSSTVMYVFVLISQNFWIASDRILNGFNLSKSVDELLTEIITKNREGNDLPNENQRLNCHIASVHPHLISECGLLLRTNFFIWQGTCPQKAFDLIPYVSISKEKEALHHQFSL